MESMERVFIFYLIPRSTFQLLRVRGGTACGAREFVEKTKPACM